MGTPEDVAAEKHFTPSTLTEMLRSNLSMEPESDAHAQVIEDELNTIKSTFKEWLRTVGLPGLGTEEPIRRLLMTLVDEP